MKYDFEGFIKPDGNKFYIEIPFNVWDATGLKGNIPVKVSIGETDFECKLLPKGNGFYWIPVKKNLVSNLDKEVWVAFEPIKSLSRINQDSPYTKENPIRKIDAISEIDSISGFCGHCCIAMLAGVSLEEVQSIMGKESASWSKIQETLDYYGISYADKMVYPKKKNAVFPKCCIIYMDGGYKLWFDGRYYGTQFSKGIVTSYLEIKVPL